ncbi:MAG TPA: DUF6265 family protein [Blastocatellia bacterium]|nr:DUF6265 family protein [Blastocatellia bacterium]HMV85388.1 DUF6265 family protein [Blastocatellia bacterium]HMX28644.1 DUF6265 family protein [Blastocatellia bacterium]HMY75072.1 DUF6265 family protein [Blastocatellia bacterium]HMZ22659.1 DUF6265 family protein [Blastocatellia bacterium]
MQAEFWKPLCLTIVITVFGLVSILSPNLEQDNKQTANTAPTFKIEDLAWMSGDWETAPGRMRIDEHWTNVTGGSMIGMSRTVAGERTVFFEYLRVETRGADIFYVAHPKARTPGTDFKLVKLSGQEAIFENLKHDFPKRIIYRKTAEGLTARIEGDGTEKEKPQDFRYLPASKAR